MIILGIESSCDETGVAIVEDGRTLLENRVASSMDVHSEYGGVIPEIAARAQLEYIVPVVSVVVDKFSRENKSGWDAIDGIAVTNGAGLSGSLLIGTLAARALAITKNKPLYSINHVEGHVYANFLNKKEPEFPLLALIVSGGHTQLVYFSDHFDYKVLGQTVDDAIGEAFDKVAKIIGLPYPGGPSVSIAAEKGDENKYIFPKPRLDSKYNFSYSGLKTAVLRKAQSELGADFQLSSTLIPNMLSEQQKYDIAASFEKTAIDIVVDKTVEAYYEYEPKSVVIAGGVAANKRLRVVLASKLPVNIDYAPPYLCTDNGAMIATLGSYKATRGLNPVNPRSLSIEPNLKM